MNSRYTINKNKLVNKSLTEIKLMGVYHTIYVTRRKATFPEGRNDLYEKFKYDYKQKSPRE